MQGLINLDRSQLKFTSRICDSCGSSKFRPLHTVEYLEIKFYFVKCNECQFVYQSPTLTRESLDHIYGTSNYWDHKGSANKSEMLNYYSYLSDELSRRKTAEWRVKFMKNYIPPGARILDLGCTEGLSLDVMIKAGYKASGIDINDSMIDYGKRRYGVDILKANFEDSWPYKEPFDAICCFTISNILSPSKVFSNIQRHLKTKGHFFFNFGDCDSLVSKALGSRFYVFRPTATSIYSKKTIIDYCKNNGMYVDKMVFDFQSIPISRLLGFLKLTQLLKILNFFGLDKTTIRSKLLSGYFCCAIRE